MVFEQRSPIAPGRLYPNATSLGFVNNKAQSLIIIGDCRAFRGEVTGNMKGHVPVRAWSKLTLSVPKEAALEITGKRNALLTTSAVQPSTTTSTPTDEGLVENLTKTLIAVIKEAV